ncbi:MAG: RraA family protein [Chloroflexi bacterium]|nr:RraA family protein [Chloroflexota bacterium]
MAESGIVVHPRSSVVWEPSIVDRFRAVAPATIGHFFEEGFMDPEIKPLTRKVKVVGPALTLFLPSNRVGIRQAIEAAQPGDVLVVDRAGERKRACFGEMLARRSLRAGIAGVIIDGPATDIIEIQELGLTVFSRGVSAVLGRGLAEESAINTPVSCGGVTVRPGDLIVADDNGIVVVRPEQAEAILAASEPAERAEVGLRQQLAWPMRK